MTTRKDLMAKCDQAWSEAVRFRGRCDLCGNAGIDFDAHHIIGRANLFTRWDTINGACLCRPCHRKVHDHGNKRLMELMTERNGSCWAEWISTARNTIYKPTDKEIESTIQTLIKLCQR